MLQIENLHVAIQSVEALRGISLQVDNGRLVGLVGRNGAGKTTLIRTLAGLITPDGGRVRVLGHDLPAQAAAVWPSIVFDGHDLLKLPAHQRAALGIGYMPEDRGLVPELSVEENILVPVWVNRALREDARLKLVYGVLPELQEMRNRRALLLSGGQQKLVALARALAAGTRLLLLDEPFEGVAPVLSKRLADVIAALKGSEVSVLIAQSDLNHSRKLVDSEVVIERGANRVRPRTDAAVQ
jgi:branched-chain amino acid transport system ATP-binding protein